MVETAQAWGWSPTAILRGADNPRKHHPADYNFALAVKTLKEERCPHCGVPIWHAYSTDSAIAFKEDMQKCESCLYQDQQKEERKEEKPGERYVVRAVPELGYDELPSRADFYERMHMEAAKRAEREVEERAKAERELAA